MTIMTAGMTEVTEEGKRMKERRKPNLGNLPFT